jgi:hypothetical protein
LSRRAGYGRAVPVVHGAQFAAAETAVRAPLGLESGWTDQCEHPSSISAKALPRAVIGDLKTFYRSHSTNGRCGEQGNLHKAF